MDAFPPSPFAPISGDIPAHTMKETHKTSAAFVTVSTVTALFVCSLLLAALYYIYATVRSKKEARRMDTDMSREFHKSVTQCMLPAIQLSSTGAQVFTYRQLQFATNNFSPANLLAKGAFGLIYRAVLPNSRLSAVKQLNGDFEQVDRQLRVEVDLLSRLHSPYVLDLLGYCADQDHRLLVYEYMCYGSLHNHLHPNDANYPFLDWGTRVRIALDAARGLEYLHEFVQPPIIHRDFTTNAILLDANYNAKISGLGIAKHGSEDVQGHASSGILGTQGYMAPEYVLTGKLTTKSDVYSFGVVLLELLTGRVPVDMTRPRGQAVLVSWALPRLTDREKVVEMMDPALQGQYSMKELIQVSAIAAMCVQPESEYRPFMTDVVQSLVPLAKQHHQNSPLSSHCSQGGLSSK